MVSRRIDFELRGRRGAVEVHYGVNDDPHRWGYDLLGLSYDIERARGCPIVHATVVHPARGYAAMLGWIQVIRYATRDTPETPEVDAPPQLAEAGVPWVAWGVLPTLFDAPSSTELNLRWRADSFLAVTPDGCMTRTVEPLCGFTWGFDIARGTARLAPLTEGLSRWDDSVDLLSGRCPGWTFCGREGMRRLRCDELDA